MKTAAGVFWTVIGAIVGAFLFIVLVSNSSKTEEGLAQQKKERQTRESQDTADSVVRNINYVKDPRTNLCFTYNILTGHGSQISTAVPCETIPPQLLTVAKLPPME